MNPSARRCHPRIFCTDEPIAIRCCRTTSSVAVVEENGNDRIQGFAAEVSLYETALQRTECKCCGQSRSESGAMQSGRPVLRGQLPPHLPRQTLSEQWMG